MKKGNKNDEEEKGKRDLKRRRSRLTITGALGILPLADPTQRGLIAAVLWLLVLPIELSLVWLGINRVRTWLRFAEKLLLTLHRVWLDPPESRLRWQFKLMLVEFVMLLFIVPELVVVLLGLLVFLLVLAVSSPDWRAGYRLITDVKEKATRFLG